MRIETSNIIAQRLDDMSHFGEYNKKEWVDLYDVLGIVRNMTLTNVHTRDKLIEMLTQKKDD